MCVCVCLCARASVCVYVCVSVCACMYARMCTCVCGLCIFKHTVHLIVVCLFIYLQRSKNWCLRCKTVGPLSASHRRNGVISTKLSACQWLIVGLSQQLPSARRRSEGQNSVRPMTTALRGPTTPAISARRRSDGYLLPWFFSWRDLPTSEETFETMYIFQGSFYFESLCVPGPNFFTTSDILLCHAL